MYERYFGGSTRKCLQTSFSATKSFVSTLVGIAIDAGLIGDVDNPLTDYVPELAARDPRFRQITLRHLLTMSSSIRYREGGFPSLGDDTYTYYGVDLRDVALKRVRIDGPPGVAWQYNNYHPLLLGLVLERATETSVSDFMATRLWQPLGAEADATWNLDSEHSGFEKMESGLNARAVDYARFGLLFLHEGEWNGRRIVSESWVRAATAADTTSDVADYPRLPILLVDRCGAAGALLRHWEVRAVHLHGSRRGRCGRSLGSRLGVGNITWLATFRDVADQLAHRP